LHEKQAHPIGNSRIKNELRFNTSQPVINSYTERNSSHVRISCCTLFLETRSGIVLLTPLIFQSARITSAWQADIRLDDGNHEGNELRCIGRIHSGLQS